MDFEAATTAFEAASRQTPARRNRSGLFYHRTAYPTRKISSPSRSSPFELLLHRRPNCHRRPKFSSSSPSSLPSASSSAARFRRCAIQETSNVVVQHHRYQTSPRRRHHRLLFACQQILTPTARQHPSYRCSFAAAAAKTAS